MSRLLSITFILLGSILLFSCNRKYVDYMDKFEGYDKTIGSTINKETNSDLELIYNDDSTKNLNTLKIENIDDEFIVGVDISSIIQVEENGGKYYDEEGNERDVFEILKEKGVNYVRIRHWNNPKNEKGDYFGGGNNDLVYNLKIAKRAARVGMKIVLNFHYSDFWADPKKQSMPRDWKDLNEEQLIKKVYDYTYETIKTFEKNKVRPHMVQIGNEINSGLIFPFGETSKGFKRISEILASGLKAVNDISPDIKTIIHLAEGANESLITNYFDNLLKYNLKFDIIGLSYYSFWHGSMEQFEETLKVLNDKYDHEIAVMEYSYAFTNKIVDNASHIFNEESALMGGYNATLQGQMSYIRDVNNAISSISKGIGSFYWEPAWLPIKNSGWASSAASSFLKEQGDDVSLGLVSWANQSLFSYSGRVLPSINVFNEMKNSTFNNEIVIDYVDEIELNINIADTKQNKIYTKATTNLHRIIDTEVTLKEEDILNIYNNKGQFNVIGTVNVDNKLKNVKVNVVSIENFLKNESFEEGGRVSSDTTNIPLWELDNKDLAMRIESKNPKTGSNNLNVYSSNDYTFKLSQELKLTPGTYNFSVYTRSANSGNDGVPNMTLFINGINYNNELIITYGSGWSEWRLNTIEFTITEEMTVNIGIKGNGKAKTWAHIDDFTFNKIE